MKCPRCQQNYPWLAKFCLECGAPVTGAAAMARSYAELKAEIEGLRRSLSEALEQQAATSEILRVISRSPTDVQPVLDTVVEHAGRLCSARDAQIFRREGEHLRLVAHHGPIPSGPVGEFTMLISRGTVNGRSVLEQRPVQVADLRAEAAEFPDGQAIALEFGHRTVLIVPLMRDGVVVGTLAVRRAEVRPFTDAQAGLLQTFADQAVIAIENVRLFNEAKEALDRQTATSEILRVISRSPTDVQPVFESVVASAARLCGANDLLLLVREDDVLRPAAGVGSLWESAPADFRVPLVRGSVAARSAIDGATLHVPDLSALSEADYPVGRELQRRFGHRTVLAVPLLREGVALGTIFAMRFEVRPFAEQQIALLKTFADQAVIAIENVRLFTELQEKNRALTEAHAQVTEALEQQTATSEILRVISGSPTDFQPSFDAIAAAAATLCAAQNAGVFLFDGTLIHLAAHHHWTAEDLDAMRRTFPRPPGRGSITARAILSRSLVHVRDITEDPEYEASAILQARVSRATLSVPMLRDGHPIGAITVARREAVPFTDTQIALLETFARQAVIAIENVRLFTETKDALEQQTATSEILRVISQSPTDVQPVFDVIVQSAVRLCGGLHSNVYRVEAGLIHLVAHHNFSPAALEHLQRRFPIPVSQGEGLAARVIREGILVHLRDAQTDPEVPETPRRTAQALGARTVLYVPMLRDRVGIGVIVVSRAEVKPFSDKEIALIRTFAAQAVIAIENVRLFTELQQKNQALTQAHAQVSEALERQTATAELLRVISRSRTELQPVFDAIAESAMRLLGAWTVVVCPFDGELLHLAAVRGGSGEPDASILSHFPTRPTTGLTVGRCILTRSVVQISDVETEAEPVAATREMARTRGWRSALAVPMLRDGAPIGAIMATHTRPRAFGPGSVELLQTFADQAVIAVENVRLLTELQEKNRALTEAHTHVTQALERQTATADILRIISRSQTDVQPVFDTIADSAIRLLQGWSALILLYDGELLHLGAARGGLPDSERYQRARFPMPLRPDHLLARCILERAPQQDPDALAHPTLGYLARARGFAAFLTVPMLRGGEAIGEVVVTRARAGPFEESEVALLQTFADQAVIAIENARLLGELQARTLQLTRSVEQLTALGEVGRALSSTLDLDAILQTIVTRASQLAGTHACSVFEYDEATEAFYLRATHNLDEEVVALARRTPTRKGEGVQGRMAITRRPAQIPDIAEGDAYRGPLRETLLATGTRAVLAIPMLREDQLIGGLTVSKKTPGEFSPEVIELLETFATQSALAIQNARLFHEIEDKSRQLEAASRHKSEFLANMSHELRTPLNAIIGFSEVLGERMFGELNVKQEEYLKDIYASGQHLLSLINDILDLSKIEAGRMELELTEFDLPTAIENALTLVRERAGRRGIALHQAVDQRLGQIRGDERKIKQVLLNLLSNALKFTPEGGRIDVRAVPGDGVVEVSVSDTGVGIAPEDQEAIFEEFRQVGTAAKKVEGTGLGLALSRKFIELHGGRIWVESQIGVGSTFTFTIPVRRDE